MSTWQQGGNRGWLLMVALALLSRMASCGSLDWSRSERWVGGRSTRDEGHDGDASGALPGGRTILAHAGDWRKSGKCLDGLPINYICNCALVDAPTMVDILQTFETDHVTCKPTCLRSLPHVCYLHGCILEQEYEVVCVQNGCGIRIDHALMTTVQSGQCELVEAFKLWDCGPVAIDIPTHHFISTGQCLTVCKGQELTCRIPTHLFAPVSSFFPHHSQVVNGTQPSGAPPPSPAVPLPVPAPRPKATARPKSPSGTTLGVTTSPDSSGTVPSGGKIPKKMTPGKNQFGGDNPVPSSGVRQSGDGTGTPVDKSPNMGGLKKSQPDSGVPVSWPGSSQGSSDAMPTAGSTAKKLKPGKQPPGDSSNVSSTGLSVSGEGMGPPGGKPNKTGPKKGQFGSGIPVSSPDLFSPSQTANGSAPSSGNPPKTRRPGKKQSGSGALLSPPGDSQNGEGTHPSDSSSRMGQPGNGITVSLPGPGENGTVMSGGTAPKMPKQAKNPPGRIPVRAPAVQNGNSTSSLGNKEPNKGGPIKNRPGSEGSNTEMPLGASGTADAPDVTGLSATISGQGAPQADGDVTAPSVAPGSGSPRSPGGSKGTSGTADSEEAGILDDPRNFNTSVQATGPSASPSSTIGGKLKKGKERDTTMTPDTADDVGAQGPAFDTSNTGGNANNKADATGPADDMKALAPVQGTGTVRSPGVLSGDAMGAQGMTPGNKIDEVLAPVPAPMPSMTPALVPSRAPALVPTPAPVTAPETALVPEPAPTPMMGLVPTGQVAAPISAPTRRKADLVAQSPEGHAVYIGPWRECSSLCSDEVASVKERGKFCVSRAGTPAPRERCADLDVDSITTLEECDVATCSSLPAYYDLGLWGPCNMSCGSGMRSRTAVCTNAAGDTLNNATCGIINQNLVEKECNTMRCEVLYYQVEDWGMCSKDCGGGNRTRAVECFLATVVPNMADDSTDSCQGRGLSRPAHTEFCNTFPCTVASSKRKLMQEDGRTESCSGRTCSGRGACVEGDCICQDGYTGKNCEKDSAGLLSCPEGSIPDSSGLCCGTGQELDGEGKCCNSTVDACGICGGDGRFIDLSGMCCSAFLDGSGLCCASGDMDECGVCDGDGSSCLTRIMVNVQVSDPNITDFDLQNCLDERISEALPVDNEEFAPELLSRAGEATDLLLVLETPGLPLTVAELKQVLGGSNVSALRALLQQNHACEIMGVSSVTKLPLCGNDICEFGEMPGALDFPAPNDLECQEDCAFKFAECPALVTSSAGAPHYCSGHGRCLFTSGGVCDCFSGYIGDGCDECDAGFLPANGRCLPAATELPGSVREASGINTDSPQGGSALAVPLSIAAGVFLCLLVAVILIKRRRNQNADVMTTMTSTTGGGGRGSHKVLDSDLGAFKRGCPEDGGHAKSLSEIWKSFISTISIGTPKRASHEVTTSDYSRDFAPVAGPSQRSMPSGQYMASGGASSGDGQYVDGLDVSSLVGSPPMTSSLGDTAPEIRNFPTDFLGEGGGSPASSSSSQKVNIIPVVAGADRINSSNSLGTSQGPSDGDVPSTGEAETTSYPIKIIGHRSPLGFEYKNSASMSTVHFDASPVDVSDNSSRSDTPEKPGSFPVGLSKEVDSSASIPPEEQLSDGQRIHRSDLSSRSVTSSDVAGNYPAWLREAGDYLSLPTAGRRVEAHPVRLSDVSGRSSVSIDNPIPGSIPAEQNEDGSYPNTPDDNEGDGYPNCIGNVSRWSATPGGRALSGICPVELSQEGSRSSTPMGAQGLEAFPSHISDVSNGSSMSGSGPSIESYAAEQDHGAGMVGAHPVCDVSSRASTPGTAGRRAFPVRLKLTSSGWSTPETDRQQVQTYPVHLSHGDSCTSTPDMSGSFPAVYSDDGSRPSTPAGGPQLESQPVRLSDVSTISGASANKGLPESLPTVLSKEGSHAGMSVDSPQLEAGAQYLSNLAVVSSGLADLVAQGSIPVQVSDGDSRASTPVTPAEGPHVQFCQVRLSDVSSHDNSLEIPGNIPVTLSEAGSHASTPTGVPELHSSPVRLGDFSTLSLPSVNGVIAGLCPIELDEGDNHASTPVNLHVLQSFPIAISEDSSHTSTPIGEPRIDGVPIRLSDVSSISGAQADRRLPGRFPLELREEGSGVSTPIAGSELCKSFPAASSDGSRKSTSAGPTQLDSHPVQLSNVPAMYGASADRHLPGSFPIAVSKGENCSGTQASQPVLQSLPILWSEGCCSTSTPIGEAQQLRMSDVYSGAGLPAGDITLGALAGALREGEGHSSTPLSVHGIDGFPVQFSDTDSHASTLLGNPRAGTFHERGRSERGRTTSRNNALADFPLVSGYYATGGRSKSATPPPRPPSPRLFFGDRDGMTNLSNSPLNPLQGFPVEAGYYAPTSDQYSGVPVGCGDSWHGSRTPIGGNMATSPARGSSMPSVGGHKEPQGMKGSELGSEFEPGSPTGSGMRGTHASDAALDVGYFAISTGSLARVSSRGVQGAVASFPIQLCDTSSRASTPSSVPGPGSLLAQSMEEVGSQSGTPMSPRLLSVQPTVDSNIASTPLSVSGADCRGTGVSPSSSTSPTGNMQGFSMSFSDDLSSVSSFGGTSASEAPSWMAIPQLSGLP
ncbi:unnamed protein product [Ostreobium quekettii]|uniref:EGF-like domain-containing protein n=1 Tax=Ostreobium quekettii TaxID=121088 RepID=A0A8S1J9D1_9CHLO|nr:unnamed protein product [Ostreobium quekettii]